ncbi:hypothetical protein [Agrobacterium tumefaciens]|uniref:hypothetical protein n=1 Tax=Agrobacterium tumefaciens TaxID=358 RepID=UPI001573C13E|nr:hypothetical protein [Agrobacterium tumefaciens]
MIRATTRPEAPDVSLPAGVQAPSPAALPMPGLPGHLQDITDRARGYIEAASSANTRRAYASDSAFRI